MEKREKTKRQGSYSERGGERRNEKWKARMQWAENRRLLMIPCENYEKVNKVGKCVY